jgi:hypothetical protein
VDTSTQTLIRRDDNEELALDVALYWCVFEDLCAILVGEIK